MPTEAALVLRRFFAFLQFLDQRVDPLGSQWIEDVASNKAAIALDCVVETFALITHGLTAGSGGSKRTLSHR